MVLIVITGPPATGKTAIAEEVEKAMGWPILSKDRIKEALFDERGISDRAWSRQLGIESYEILGRRAAELFQTKKSFIIEGNFSGETAQAIKAQAEKLKYEIRQISCDAPDAVITERIRERWESGRRHRGHQDDETLREIDQGRSWGKERGFRFSENILRLDEANTLQENIDRALEYVRALS